jgi:hypothetical protein
MAILIHRVLKSLSKYGISDDRQSIILYFDKLCKDISLGGNFYLLLLTITIHFQQVIYIS